MPGPSVKIAAEWLDSDEAEHLGADAAMLLLSALAYSARHLTDGVVPQRRLRKLWPVDDVEAEVGRLVEAGAAELVGEDVHIVRWHDFILASTEVEHIRKQGAERQERYRRHQNGDHSLCDRCSSVRNGSRNGVTNAATDGVSDAPPIRSSPTRSSPTQREERGAGSGAGGGGRFADATRPPRLLTGEEWETLVDSNLIPHDDADVGPRDLVLRHDIEGRHAEVYIRPVLLEEQEPDVHYCRAVLGGLHSMNAPTFAGFAAEHGCNPTDEDPGCGMEFDPEALDLSAHVPAAHVEVWADRLRTACIEHMNGYQQNLDRLAI